MCMITLFSAYTCASWYDHMLNRMRVRIDNLMIIMMVICGFFCLVLSIWLGIRWRPGAYRYAYSSEYRTQGLVLSLQVARSLLWRRCAPRHRVRLKVEVSDWPEFMRKPVNAKTLLRPDVAIATLVVCPRGVEWAQVVDQAQWQQDRRWTSVITMTSVDMGSPYLRLWCVSIACQIRWTVGDGQYWVGSATALWLPPIYGRVWNKSLMRRIARTLDIASDGRSNRRR